MTTPTAVHCPKAVYSSPSQDVVYQHDEPISLFNSRSAPDSARTPTPHREASETEAARESQSATRRATISDNRRFDMLVIAADIDRIRRQTKPA